MPIAVLFFAAIFAKTISLVDAVVRGIAIRSAGLALIPGPVKSDKASSPATFLCRIAAMLPWR